MVRHGMGGQMAMQKGGGVGIIDATRNFAGGIDKNRQRKPSTGTTVILLLLRAKQVF